MAWKTLVRRGMAFLMCWAVLLGIPAAALDLTPLGLPKDHREQLKDFSDTSISVTSATAKKYLKIINDLEKKAKNMLANYADGFEYHDMQYGFDVVNIDQYGEAELVVFDAVVPALADTGGMTGMDFAALEPNATLQFKIYSTDGEIYSSYHDILYTDTNDMLYIVDPPYVVGTSTTNAGEKSAAIYEMKAGSLKKVFTSSPTSDEWAYDYDELISKAQELGIEVDYNSYICRYDDPYETGSRFQIETPMSLPYEHHTLMKEELKKIANLDQSGSLLSVTDPIYQDITETVALWDSIFECGNADLTLGELPPVNAIFPWFGKFEDTPIPLDKMMDRLTPESTDLAKKFLKNVGGYSEFSVYPIDTDALNRTLKALYGENFDCDAFYRIASRQGEDPFYRPLRDKQGNWYVVNFDLGTCGYGYEAKVCGVSNIGDGFYTAQLASIYIDEGQYYEGDYYMLLQRTPEGGPLPYQIRKIGKGAPNTSAINALKNKLLTPNTQYDYQKVGQFTKSQQFLTYLEEQLAGLNGTPINDKGKLETARYIEFLYENATVSGLAAKRKGLVINQESLEQSVADLNQLKQQVNDLLKKYSINLNKELQTTVKLSASGLNADKPISVEIEQNVLETLDGVQTLRVLFDGQGTGFSVAVADLVRALSSRDSFSFKLNRDGSTYALVFQDGKQELAKSDAPITLYLPANTPYASIEVKYGDYLDNWGGQYDDKNGLIFFTTELSGLYTVVENDITITDIGDLTEEQQKMIRFMVSKGFFTVENGVFGPSQVLNRYDFSTALVKMFYALDRDLTCSFTDVPSDSIYYPYVASTEQAEIAFGIGNDLFAGEKSVTKEEVLAFCARTLTDKKGYQAPDDLDRYGNFTDRDKISQWALEFVALTEQLGLIEGGGELNPQGEVTRVESVEMLYQLFMMLYEVSPVETQFYQETAQGQAEYPPIVWVMGGLVILGCAAAVLQFTGFGKSWLQKSRRRQLILNVIAAVIALSIFIIGMVSLAQSSGFGTAENRSTVQSTAACNKDG